MRIEHQRNSLRATARRDRARARMAQRANHRLVRLDHPSHRRGRLRHRRSADSVADKITDHAIVTRFRVLHNAHVAVDRQPLLLGGRSPPTHGPDDRKRPRSGLRIAPESAAHRRVAAGPDGVGRGATHDRRGPVASSSPDRTSRTG